MEAGTVIAGRYRLAESFGTGGAGEVFQASDERLRRPVAIKLLFRRAGEDDNAATEHFLREARIAAKVQHRNVVQTVDFGVHEGVPYMVMELLRGETLEDRLKRARRVDDGEALRITMLVLRGLTAVHDAGIVHRDLKPGNIFLAEDDGRGFPKILDFGISRSSAGESAVSTAEGRIVGTIEYMSPEQTRSLQVGTRSDVFSVAAMLYEMLTGQLPFTAATPLDLLIAIGSQAPRDIAELRPDLDITVRTVIMRALSPDPLDRYGDARDMRAALAEATTRAEMDLGTISDFSAYLSAPPRRHSDLPHRGTGTVTAERKVGPTNDTMEDLPGAAPPAAPRAAPRPPPPARPAPARPVLQPQSPGGSDSASFDDVTEHHQMQRIRAPRRPRLSLGQREVSIDDLVPESGVGRGLLAFGILLLLGYLVLSNVKESREERRAPPAAIDE